MKRAVVFDCDGVLIDSEPLAEAAWTEALRRRGHDPTAAEFESVRGLTASALVEFFADKVVLPPLTELLVEVHAYWDLHIDRLRAFPDAVEMVRALASDAIPMAVASSSRRAELNVKLNRFDLARYFDVTVAGDEVAAGKPAPDVFQAAADGLGVDASLCLAIDDTEPGADAAVAAGMRTVRLARNGEISARHPVVSSLDPGLVEHWLGLR